MNIKNILTHYLICALWSSNKDDGEPFDKNHSIDDIDQESKEKAEKDIISFVEQAGSLLNNIPDDQIGHDFWLTRNWHGTGFWDRGYEKSIGDELTKISHSFGESNLYMNDENKVSIF